MSKQYDQKFKENAVAYYLEHKELGLEKAAENLGIGRTTLGAWTKAARENNGSVPTRGSGNFESDEAKRNCQIKKRTQRYKGCFRNIKKSNQHSGRLTQAYFIQTANAEENAKTQGRSFNVSGVLRILGVSRNGYYSFKKHSPSHRQIVKEERMDMIRSIHDSSHQNYVAPKITAIMKEAGEKISEKVIKGKKYGKNT